MSRDDHDDLKSGRRFRAAAAPADADDLRQRLLEWRGVEDPCLKCSGSGTRAYGSTATWRGGMGGQMITSDVCDACWGSGDRYRTWTDLRRLRGEETKRVADTAATALVESVGGTWASNGKHVVELLLELDKIIDRRRLPVNVFTLSLVVSLRNLIARAVGATERRL